MYKATRNIHVQVFVCRLEFLTGETYGKSLFYTKPLLRVAVLFCIPSKRE